MSDYRTNFPSQVVSDLEKDTFEYGLEVGKAIENEWFFGDHTNRFHSLKNNFHELRLYARGEQSIQKYKDELSINGDLSYLNLDWTPVPIIPKFVDIVVNGMAERNFEVKAYSRDPYGVAKRTGYMKSLMLDMKAKEFNNKAKQALNIDLFNNNPETLPETKEELDLHMQLDYKQSIEIAEEQAINVLLDGSNYSGYYHIYVDSKKVMTGKMPENGSKELILITKRKAKKIAKQLEAVEVVDFANAQEVENFIEQENLKGIDKEKAAEQQAFVYQDPNNNKQIVGYKGDAPAHVQELVRLFNNFKIIIIVIYSSTKRIFMFK